MSDSRPVSIFEQLAAVPALKWVSAATLFFLFTSGWPTPVVEALQWERTLLQGGELWRLVSAHFVHTRLLDGLASSIGLWIAWLVWRRSIAALPTTLIALCIATATSLVLFAVTTIEGPIVGASPLLHGGLAFLIVRDVLNGHREALLLGVGLGVKLALEAIAPEVFEATRSFASADYAIAHQSAAIVGATIAALYQVIQSRKK